MGWAHLGFWGSLFAFTVASLATYKRERAFLALSHLDDGSRLKYLRGQHKSRRDRAEDEKAMRALAFCFCALCLFGHLAGSPISDAWSAYGEFVESLED